MDEILEGYKSFDECAREIPNATRRKIQYRADLNKIENITLYGRRLVTPNGYEALVNEFGRPEHG